MLFINAHQASRMDGDPKAVVSSHANEFTPARVISSTKDSGGLKVSVVWPQGITTLVGLPYSVQSPY